MSDKPADAQKLIAEVIGGHRYDISDVHVHRCVCGAVIGRDPDALDMHRAAEVDKALGGLTRERRKILASGVILSADAEGWEGYATRQSRFVSGWTVTE
ncbi:hypothetical protein [Mycobacteroides abscessus]|uniref:hypothetical protein n=1 Tax=Mycobacteroides abscessus TaxID=36809 RepID=UPI001F349637|nr:hypothetical protein [Mycobacteroides abscessus]